MMDGIIVNDIGKRLSMAVSELGFMSHADFIRGSKISKSTFYTLIKENRRPNSKTLELLNRMGINTLWLLTGQGNHLLTGFGDPYKLAKDISGEIEQGKWQSGKNDSQPNETSPQGAQKEGTKETNVGSSAGSSPWMEIKDDLKKFTELLERGMQREPARPGEVIEVRHPEIEVFKIIDKLISRLNQEQLMMLQAKIENQLEEKSEQPTH